MVIQEVSTNTSNWPHQEMSDYNEDLAISAKTLLFDSSNPNDDMWRKFALPLTPPSSPPRSLGETSDCSETTEDIANRLQDVCDSLDSAFDIRSCVLPDAKYLRSKLISDCMWSGSLALESKNTTQKIDLKQKLSIDTEEDLYPTPCASPIPNVTEPVTDYSTNSDCVDPTTVFPFPHSQDSVPSILSGQSDSDEEIDVVTVDAPITSNVTPITVGIKRKHISNTIILTAKVRNTLSPPSFKRTKSLPSKSSIDKDLRLSRRANSTTNADESDPEMRRATHNVLERKRRIDLKKSFERLRECVPNLEKIDKTPKVIVLKKAAMHIEDLNREDMELQEQKLLLTEENEELKQKLQLLQSSFNFD